MILRLEVSKTGVRKTGVRAKFSLIFASREPNVLTTEIVEDLEAALEQFREITGDLAPVKPETPN